MMMGHWIVAPVVLPSLIAALIVLVMRHDIVLQRVASIVTTAALALIGGALLLAAADGTVEVYRLGNWPAPFGIVLVLDRLSALMVALTGVLALIVVLYATGSGWDARGKHFHALFQFQLMGIFGAFLTGDAFNLFVFFEVLLIASYGLMIHAGGAVRLRAGVQYVVYNLAGSTLFLFALGTIYGVTGTLNMADLAERMAALDPPEHALARVAAVLLLLVFAVKAALVPLQFWLPGTYSNAPAPVAALFAIMTKVGAYAIIRVHTLAFGPDTPATGTLVADLLLPAALVTLVVGALGVLGAARMGRLIAFSVIGSMGTLFVAVAMFTPAALTAGLYYLVHSTFAAAALFLVADLAAARRGADGDRLRSAPAMAQNGLIAGLFFAAAIGMAGMPPLSGFLGKLYVMDTARDAPQVAWIWAAIVITSLVTIVGFARAGSVVFWKSAATPGAPPEPQPGPAPALAFTAAGAAVAAMAGLSALAGPVSGYMAATAAQVHAPGPYIAAVLDIPDDAAGAEAARQMTGDAEADE